VITDAVNTSGDNPFIYPKWLTCIGDSSGNRPTKDDESEDIVASRVVQSASGSRLDYADLTWILREFMKDRNQPADFRRMIGVFLPDTANTRIHLGDYLSETERVDQTSETLTASSQIRGYHFGSPIRYMPVWNPLTSGITNISGPVMFNPEYEGKVRFNRSDKQPSSGTGYVWIHPESAITLDGKDYHDTLLNEWTLQKAVEAICELLNPDEQFITNPTDLTILATTPDLRNVILKPGMRLHECLDAMLIPLGYNWYLDYDNVTKPEITIFEIGAGDEKELYFQEPAADPYDANDSNCNQYEVTRGIGDSFNAVRVLGDYEAYEITLPLYPVWDDTHSSLTAADLAKTSATYIGKEDVWRYWPANEAGDHDPATTTLGQAPTVPTLDDVFTEYVPHRRRIEEPITYIGGSGSEKRRPLFLEYSTDSGSSWLPFDDAWHVKLLPDQIGILFDGEEPPEELVNAGTAARVRITGTVYGDYRIEGFADRETFAVNGRRYEQVLDMADKFQFRQRMESGTYASVLASDGSSNDADEVDHTTEIQDYAEEIRDKNHHAEVNAEFRLPGWHLEYKIGDLITKIAGREINLDAASEESPTNRYPQIVERRFEYSTSSGPSTVLIVDRGISGYIKETPKRYRSPEEEPWR